MLDPTILSFLEYQMNKIEEIVEGDAMSYSGPIHHALLKDFRNYIERLASRKNKKHRLIMFLKTAGGVVEPVEKMVEIIRHHYDEVFFFVPDYAMSAGTILCMSGNKIYMDYSSSLGPIDPQVRVHSPSGEDQYVPALGYLEQVERLVKKSTGGQLSPAEYGMLQNLDLAMLNLYEQARDLSIELLKRWLVEYKFSSWSHHRTTGSKRGKKVTKREKEERAEEIAAMLSDHSKWHSHGRMIGIDKLRGEMRLEIDDYSENASLAEPVRQYNDVLTDYIDRQGYPFYLHSRQIIGEA